jgi:hypothetical protein
VSLRHKRRGRDLGEFPAVQVAPIDTQLQRRMATLPRGCGVLCAHRGENKEVEVSLELASRSRPQTRKSSRPAEFKQAKRLTARADYQFDRMSWMRVQREYFSPYTCRQ